MKESSGLFTVFVGLEGYSLFHSLIEVAGFFTVFISILNTVLGGTRFSKGWVGLVSSRFGCFFKFSWHIFFQEAYK